MALRYYIDLPCIPRDSLGAPDIVELLMKRERANELAEAAGDVDESAVKVRVQIQDIQGASEERVYTIAELRSQSAPLDELAGYCANCPASLSEDPFGCVQKISFPIDPAAEEWLLSLIDEGAVKVHAEAARIMAPDEQEAESFARLRSTRLFAQPKGPSRQIGDLTFSVDDLLAVLFGRNQWKPESLFLPLLLFDFISFEDGRRGDEVLTSLQAGFAGELAAEGFPGIIFDPRLEDHPIADPTSAELTLFLMSMYLAMANGVPLRLHS